MKGGIAAWLSIVCFTYFPTFQTKIFCIATLLLFLTIQGRFFASRIFMVVIITAEIIRAVVKLKLKVK